MAKRTPSVPAKNNNRAYGEGHDIDNPAFPTERYFGDERGKTIRSPHESTFEGPGEYRDFDGAMYDGKGRKKGGRR